MVFQKKTVINFLPDLNREIFRISLVTYLVFLLLEEIKKGFISYNFNLNILLGLVIISGVLTIFTKNEGNKKPEQIKKIDWLFIFGLGILGSFLIFYKTKELGWISYLISAISGFLIILLSIIILKEDEDET